MHVTAQASLMPDAAKRRGVKSLTLPPTEVQTR